MFLILCGISLIGIVWFFYSKASQKKFTSAFNEADLWFKENQIKSDSVYFGAYSQLGLAINQGATVLVGTGKKTNGDNIGFVIEVIANRGVVLSAFIEPYGVATWHKNAAMQAKLLRKPLMDVLKEMAEVHQKKYPDWDQE